MGRNGKERFWRGEYPVNREEFPFWSERIQAAYDVGLKAHEGQTRVTTGEPYFNHCIEVAGIIESWCYTKESKFVEDLVCAALLHDTVEDTDLTLEQIKEMFGEEVAFLVDGVSKFKSEEGKGSNDHETIKKVLEGYFVDPRVAILKLADRVQNMKSLKDMPVGRQGPKAWETEEVYARIAEALGMWEVMRNLKDASFPLRFPERFREVSAILEKDPRRSPEYISALCDDVERIAEMSRIKCEVGFRLAGLRQVDQKRRRQKRLLGENGYEDVSDVVSIGVSVDTVDDCYRMLGQVRGYYTGNLDLSRGVDTIAVPADNGYRALKEVINLGFGAVEIVIMTKEMEEFNNWGVVSLIRSGVEDLSGFRMKIIFTPDNEVRVLSLVATGWDAAAAINPELVKRMTVIKVNGEYCLPCMQVPHAAEVEVIARKTGVYLEDRSWSTASSRRTERILQKGLERVEYEKTVEWGEIKAKYMLAQRGVLTFEDIRDEIIPRLSELGCRTISELLFAIGGGEIDDKRLDGVLDKKGHEVNKQTLGLTTVLVSGKDGVGILHKLTGMIWESGGNIVRSVNRGLGEYELRIVIKGMNKKAEDELRRRLVESGSYKEVLVV